MKLTTLATIGLLVFLASCTSSAPDVYQPIPGDVLFQSLPHSPLIDTIEGASGSPFSHCGIVSESAGQTVVLEAFQSVRSTPLAEWIDQGRGGAFTAFRWRDDLAGSVPGILIAAEQYMGRPYDIHYAMDDEAIYCSELIFKAFRTVTGDDLGTLAKLGDLDWQPYEQTIREIEDGGLPLERVMITPLALSEAPQLRKVHSYGW